MKERITVDFDSQSYYLDGEFWESWDNYGEELAEKINKLLDDENKFFFNVHEISEIEKMIISLTDYIEPFKELESDDFKGVICKVEEMLSSEREQFELYSLILNTLIVFEELKRIKNKYYADEEIEVKINAQKKYCGENTPLFAPEDGICGFCFKQIYTDIPLERASEELITNCPHCSHTFCD